MAIIGLSTVLIAILALVAASVTGRKQWLIIWLWCMPTFGMVYFAPPYRVINGLVIVICATMSLEIAYALWGVKLWCVQTRQKKPLLQFVVGFLNFIVITYCFCQSIVLNYWGNTDLDNPFSIAVAAFVVALAMTMLMQDISITVIGKYFSKKESFSLIKCSPIIKTKRGKREIYRKYAIKGIQNGETYVFNMTRKAYMLLKPHKAFVFDVRRGVLGGVYVTGNVYEKDSKRRINRVTKVLAYRTIFVVLAAVLIALLIMRIKTGADFQQIFLQIGRGVTFWKN